MTGAVALPAYAAAAGDEPIVRIAAIGDVGTGSDAELGTAKLVADASSSDPYDALALVGDNVYPDGDPDRLQATVFGPFAPVLDQGAELLPVLGNHDIRNGHAAGQMAALGMPWRWYSTLVGPVLFVALDSNLVDNADQQRWLESTLADNAAEWTIVAMHHPAYSAGEHGSTADVQEEWVPVFERFGVDLVLAGHDHDYQRSKLINGITYLVSGGGARLRPTGREHFTAYSESVLHFVDIAVWSDRIEVKAISRGGVFDQATLTGWPPPESGAFVDDDVSVFEIDIEWLAAEQITRGCGLENEYRFCPDQPVSRGEMAAFMSRFLGLSGDALHDFTDMDGSIYAAEVGRLVERGVTRGCNPPANDRYCPDDPVTRSQMAALLSRGLGLSDTSTANPFEDDDESVFEGDITRLVASSITHGCDPPDNRRFCPDDLVTRGQMAAFLHRAANLRQAGLRQAGLRQAGLR